jgi:hypothetical protein
MIASITVIIGIIYNQSIIPLASICTLKQKLNLNLLHEHEKWSKFLHKVNIDKHVSREIPDHQTTTVTKVENNAKLAPYFRSHDRGVIWYKM